MTDELDSLRIVGQAYVHANPEFPDSFKLKIVSCLPERQPESSSRQSRSTGARFLRPDLSTKGEHEFLLNREVAKGLLEILRKALDENR